MRYYTGVGRRAENVAPGVREYINWLAGEMASRDIYLVSGDASGIDSYFEESSSDKCKIYLPYKGFGGYPGRPEENRILLNPEEARLAEDYLSYYEILPEITRMRPANKRYHLRNFYQSFNCGDFPEVCFYYALETSDGILDGGTRTAVYTARHFEIPCYNLFTQEGRDLVTKLLLAGEWD